MDREIEKIGDEIYKCLGVVENELSNKVGKYRIESKAFITDALSMALYDAGYRLPPEQSDNPQSLDELGVQPTERTDKREVEYTLTCEGCGEAFYSKEAFPSPQLCPKCLLVELSVHEAAWEAARKEVVEEIKKIVLPTEKGTNIPFKVNPELTTPAQKEVVDTAIMAYKQAEQDVIKTILKGLRKHSGKDIK